MRTNKSGKIEAGLTTRADRPLKIGLLGPHEARILDVAGPWEVFTRANEILGEQQPNQKPGYDLKLVAIDSSKLIHCFGQLRIRSDANFRSLGTDLDTLLVAGGRAPWELPKNEDFLSWLREMSGRVRRLAAIGSGVFFLAEAGLLQGKRVTTHWRWADRLKKSYPGVLVDPAPVFVHGGRLYTASCASVSMDLTLAMVKEDYGQALAGEVAKHLVVFVYRPEGQPQVSQSLTLQVSGDDRFRDLHWWILDHLDKDLSIDALAKRVAMSVRNFRRRFRQSFGVAPAEFVTRARVEAAWRRLEEGRSTIEQVATECGFSSADLLRRAFHRTLGTLPSQTRERGGASAL